VRRKKPVGRVLILAVFQTCRSLKAEGMLALKAEGMLAMMLAGQQGSRGK
jgi:hypothetical protein